MIRILRWAVQGSWVKSAVSAAVLLGSTALALGQAGTTGVTPVPQANPVTAPAPGTTVVIPQGCGACDHSCWTPLCHSTLLSEGWLEPWIAPPNGPSGAPRQGWINSFDGHFTREWHLVYAWTNELPDGSEAHLGLFQFNTPLSRRLWIGIDVPFIVALQGDNGADDVEDFGDIVINPGVMLTETEDVSISARLGIRIPTGEEETGGDIESWFPRIEGWADIGGAWTLRGGVGAEFFTEDDIDADGQLVTNLAIGHTITPHEATPFGDFAYYLAFNMRNDFGGDDDHTFISLTPGIRTHLGCDTFFLAGWEVPVTGPRPFDERIIVAIVKGF